MKEKYTFAYNEDGTENALACIWALVMMGLIIITALATKSALLGMLIFFVMLAVLLVIETSKASFDAGRDGVTFSHLGKKTVIRYDDITDMKLDRQNREVRGRGGVTRFYAETLTITAGGKEYKFTAKMEIDYNKVAQDPASLQEQFENSKFSKLKRYIEDCMGIVSRS